VATRPGMHLAHNLYQYTLIFFIDLGSIPSKISMGDRKVGIECTMLPNNALPLRQPLYTLMYILRLFRVLIWNFHLI
jgi:hypothetical protein